MATLSVLGYNLPQGLKMKAIGSEGAPTAAPNSSSGPTNLCKPFNKITVQNVLSENNGNTLNISNNNVNTIVRKIKDFGMFGAVNNASSGKVSALSNGALTVIAHKRPLSELKDKEANKAPSVSVTKKSKPVKDAATPKSTKKSMDLAIRLKLAASGATPPTSKQAGTPGRKGLPLPQAVARRNARERNRVKQVNNGFAALRERIPEEVAEAFESQGNGRGSVKKLSKVETLRMAVEYIRSLERLLGFDFPLGSDRGLLQGFSSGEDSFSIIKDEFDELSPDLDEQYEDSLSNYDMEDYFATTSANNSISAFPQSNELAENMSALNQLDLLPNITTLNGLQYIRIPGTNTYQLLTPDIFAGNSHSPPNSSIDEEQFNALIDTNCLSPTGSNATSADLHSSPPSIIAATTATTSAPAAPATPNGVCVVNAAISTLSRSPSPTLRASTSLHHQQELLQPATATTTTTTLSPAANEVLLPTCATTERHFVAPTPPYRMIKQEFSDAHFVSTLPSPELTSVIFQQTQAHCNQLLLGHASLAMSPPLDRCNSAPVPLLPLVPTSLASNIGLQGFYEHEQENSFYEGVVTFKKEHNDVLLGTSANAHALSDESMMEAIDWWEAHTPKSDGGGSVML